MRIAILGLYNSGSTAIAGMLHKMGVNLGAPFYADFYEPNDLGWHLRRWWQEPRMIESEPVERRIAFLRRWIELQECVASPVGAKAPLLSLCCYDLVRAWGNETLFIWCYRSLDASVAGLQRRKWVKPEVARAMQDRLWDVLHEFERAFPVHRINWDEVKSNPRGAARELATLCELGVTDEQIDAAAGTVSRSDARYRYSNSIVNNVYRATLSRLEKLTK